MFETCHQKIFYFFIFCSISTVYCGQFNCQTSSSDIFLQYYNKSDLNWLPTTLQQFMLYSQLNLGLQLKEIPNRVFANFCIVSLDLSNNQINNIARYSFSGLLYLKTLTLKNNQIESIDNLIDSLEVGTLSTLDLSLNQLKRLEKKFSPFFANLTFLYFDNNKIEYIGDFVFGNLMQLESLYFQNNWLKSIGNFTFRGLHSLSSLYMDDNFISSIELLSFEDLGKLRTISLTKNSIERISQAFTKLSKVQSLVLKNNRIKALEKGAFAGLKFVYDLDISGNFLNESVYLQGLTNLIVLKLNYENLGPIDSQLFSGFTKLYNLYMVQSKITSIENGAFRDLSGLIRLELSYNQLSRIDRDVFVGLSSLSYLLLDSNIISNFDEGSFSPLLNIIQLGISRNLLSRVPNNLFTGLNKLSKIDLSFNLLTTIQSGCFCNLKFLAELLLNGNLIEKIEPHAFENLTLFQKLDLSGNKLREIHDYYFSGLTSVRKIILKGNGINFISKNSFRNLMRTDLIDLSENFLISIEPVAIKHIECDHLDLSHNQLDQLDPNIFEDLIIKTVSLQRNNFKSLGAHMLTSLVNTSRLEFGSCQISFISTDLFASFDVKIAALFLDNNNLKSLAFLNSSGLENLIELDVSWNFIELVLDLNVAVLKSLQVVNLSHNPIKFIQPEILTAFAIRSINMSSLAPSIELKVYKNVLESVDLSQNRVENLDLGNFSVNLKYLYVQDTNLNNLSVLNFSLVTNLLALDLSGNLDDDNFVLAELPLLEWLSLTRMGIRSIDKFEFSRFFKLNYLNLSNNCIVEIDDSHFSSLYFLKTLDLSHNKISSIDPESVATMFTLSFLNLEGNFIKTLSLKPLPNLEVFNLRRNNIFYFEFFASMIKLKLLNKFYLSYNAIVSLQLYSLIDENTNLAFLELEFNQLSHLDSDIFAKFFNLKDLYLDSNQISVIDWSTFSNLDKLEHLNLGNNSISFLYPSTFSNLFHLASLNLSLNQIEKIDSSLFSRLVNLRTLDLSFNRLKFIEGNSFAGASLLVDLYINDNSDGMLLAENCLFGLKSIVNLFVSFRTLNDEYNKMQIIGSLEPRKERTVGDVVYYRSINVIYKNQQKHPDMNCTLVIDFLRCNIQINLKTDDDFLLFLLLCQQNLYFS